MNRGFISLQLAADLKFKDEELENLSSQVSGFVEQIGHLQTSKDQVCLIKYPLFSELVLKL